MTLGLNDSPASSAVDEQQIRRLWPELAALPRWATRRDESRQTIGGQLAEIHTTFGHDPMPWQRLVFDVGGELDPDGKLHYRVIIVTIHRQGGKTTLVLPWEVHRGVVWKTPQRVVYAAQNRVEARKKLIDEHIPAIEESTLGYLGKPRLSSGMESWKWFNGSQIGLIANTKRAGHGFTNALVVVDEAWAQIDWRLEQQLAPTMITVDEPQWITISTAGDETSVYLLEQVRRGRHLVESGADQRVAYFEWSIPLDADIDDPEVWKRYMPAVGITIDVEALKAERARMPDAEFRRAFGNQWIEGVQLIETVIPEADWTACADKDSKMGADAVRRMAVDVSPGQRSASIGVAGRRDDELVHVEAMDTRDGIGWVVERCAEMARMRPAYEDSVVLDMSTPAAALAPALEAAGLTIIPISGRDWNAACAALYAGATDHTLRHIDDPELTAAQASAGQTFSGEGWHWNRRGAASITPICAVTLAHWALVKDAGEDYDVAMSFY